MEYRGIVKIKSVDMKKTKVLKKYLSPKYRVAIESIIIQTQIVVVVIIAILFFVLLLLYYFFAPVPNCYFDKHWNDGKTLNEISSNRILIEMLSSSDNNIFFHETSFTEDGIIKLNARQACAIESAALTNPNHNIVVMFASQVGFRNTTELPIIDAILSYPNVHLNYLNMTKYAEDTPLEDWIKTDKLFRSKYVVSHTSDVLRFLSLFKYGGTHIDLDVVMLQPLDTQKPHNFAAAETYESVNVALLHVEGETGHEIAEKLVKDLKDNFNGRDWANNGPMVLTRVLYEICDTKDIKTMITTDKCKNFRVLPIEKCYDIKWQEHEMFFKEENLNQTLTRLRNSLMAHIWNSQNVKTPLSKNDNAAYIHLAKKYCPKTFNACTNKF